MPIIETSTYKAPWWLKNRHLQTMYPSLFREVTGVTYTRQRIDTPDDDFIDLDQSLVGGKNAVIVAHGLGGHSYRAYMKGMIKAFNKAGWDGFAFNFRSCSGEINRQLRFYHSGDTADFHTAVSHILQTYSYQSIALVGFSMGGNVTVKYLGEQGKHLLSPIRAAAVFSVPCHLDSSCARLDSPSNYIYMKRFLRMLHRTIKAKMEIMPERLNDDAFRYIRTLREYDNHYTAPIHGFENAEDYYNKSSCLPYIAAVTIPTLMVNAQNDPFLAPQCFPVEEARDHPQFFLEMPKTGGHTGFIRFNEDNEYWSESRAISFILSYCTQTK
jgi:predicted alpha/beta-fold hydrolase